MPPIAHPSIAPSHPSRRAAVTRRTALLLALAGGVQASPAPPSVHPAAPPATTLGGVPIAEADLRAWLAAARRRHGVPGVSLATVEDGAVRAVIAAGVADADRGTPVTPDTRFEAASLTKPVASRWFVRETLDAGGSLDTPLAARCADLGLGTDARVASLTARQLLSHQAGLPNWRDTPGGELRFVAEPGRGLAYSGEGYDALGRVLACRAGTDDRGLAERFRALLARPWGLPTLGFPVADCDAGRASPHRAGRVLPARPCPQRVGFGWSLHTSARDYAGWMARVMAGDDLPRDVDADWWRGQSVTIPAAHPGRSHGLVDWSLGFAIHDLPFGRVWLHTGDQTGYTALAVVAADRRRGLVVLTNADAAHGFLLELVGFLASPSAGRR